VFYQQDYEDTEVLFDILDMLELAMKNTSYQMNHLILCVIAKYVVLIQNDTLDI
jgi:hypothetical protein